MPRIGLAALVLLALTACSAPSSSDAQPPRSAAPAGRGTIAGTVTTEREVPPAELLRFDADPQCEALLKGEAPHAENLVVSGSKGVQNVFVYVKEGLRATSYPAGTGPVTIDQQTCRFVPRVVGVQVGQTLRVRNSDPLLHTIRADSTANPKFNVATPVPGIEITRTFKSPEVMIPIGCDMHPWMRAWVGVLPHPFFAVTDQEGRFTIPNLPPGAYVLEFWHERLGTTQQSVSVQQGQTSEIQSQLIGVR